MNRHHPERQFAEMPYRTRVITIIGGQAYELALAGHPDLAMVAASCRSFGCVAWCPVTGHLVTATDSDGDRQEIELINWSASDRLALAVMLDLPDSKPAALPDTHARDCAVVAGWLARNA